MSLHRRKMKSALEEGTGWTVESRVSGLVDVYPPEGRNTVGMRDEVVRRVRELGYEPKIVASRDAKGKPCIQFRTDETMEQQGEGGHGFKK